VNADLKPAHERIVVGLKSGTLFTVVERFKNADPKPINERLAEKGG
jgi:hypothetical protein